MLSPKFYEVIGKACMWSTMVYILCIPFLWLYYNHKMKSIEKAFPIDDEEA